MSTSGLSATYRRASLMTERDERTVWPSTATETITGAGLLIRIVTADTRTYAPTVWGNLDRTHAEPTSTITTLGMLGIPASPYPTSWDGKRHSEITGVEKTGIQPSALSSRNSTLQSIYRTDTTGPDSETTPANLVSIWNYKLQGL